MGTTLQDQFVLFSKFGDAKSDGKTITLTQSDKWLKQALILDGRKITVTDTGIVFNYFNYLPPTTHYCRSRTLTFNEFLKYIDALCREYNLERDQVRFRLASCGPPGTNKMLTKTENK